MTAMQGQMGNQRNVRWDIDTLSKKARKEASVQRFTECQMNNRRNVRWAVIKSSDDRSTNVLVTDPPMFWWAIDAMLDEQSTQRQLSFWRNVRWAMQTACCVQTHDPIALVGCQVINTRLRSHMLLLPRHSISALKAAVERHCKCSFPRAQTSSLHWLQIHALLYREKKLNPKTSKRIFFLGCLQAPSWTELRSRVY